MDKDLPAKSFQWSRKEWYQCNSSKKIKNGMEILPMSAGTGQNNNFMCFINFLIVKIKIVMR